MIIDDWHGQACVHALSEAPAFLLIQLNRFSGDDGGRSHCRVQHGDTRSVPTFRNSAVLDAETQLLQYRLVSIIIHKGVHSTSGHYQAATVDDVDQLWLHDDGSTPTPQHDLEDIYQNTYLLCFQRNSPTVES